MFPSTLLQLEFFQIYMDFFNISKQDAEQRISETPVHKQDSSDIESDMFESDDADGDDYYWISCGYKYLMYDQENIELYRLNIC